MHTESMKRKVAKVAPLRVSPNEEALILKQERERRRKLRLQQVREQEKFIAQQIRQDVKERRDQQLQRLAEDLKAKWEAEQAEKLRTLEKIYLSTLSAIGEGHRNAKENEPDLKAIERTAALNKEKAEKRHREALKELQQHREKLLREQTWHIKARRKALHIEKERAAKIASLPPPPPDPLENIEVVKRPPLVKLCNVDGFSQSHYHLPEAYVDREVGTGQPDARVAAIEEGKRLESLQKEEEHERREQMEKAALRGAHALKMVQLTQDRDRLMKELEKMQQEDLTHRRHIISQMPQQLFEPPYRRSEILEEWQRELESAFEDMYTKDTKMKGDMVLHLKPQPLPDLSVASIDENLDLSVEPEVVSAIEPQHGERTDSSLSDEPQEAEEPQSRLVLRRLLNRIRTQKDQWSARSDGESETLESGSLPLENVEERQSDSQEPKEVTDNTVLAGNSVLLHPQEQAAHIRLETERRKKMETLERQKVEQLELLKRLEEEREALEEEYGRVQLQMQEASSGVREPECVAALQEVKSKPASPTFVTREEPSGNISEANMSAENLHIQMIREYQQRLIEQNRLHKESVDQARNRLQEYQLLLKKRYPHLSTSCQEMVERNLESVETGQSPKSDGQKYVSNAGSYPYGTVSDPYTNPVLVESGSEQKNQVHIPQTSRTLQSKETKSVLQGPVPMGPNSTGDSLMLNSAVSQRLDQSIKSLQATGASKNGSVMEGPPQEQIPHPDSPYRSPCDEKSRFPHIGDKQSSTSSPGEYETSSSTSYNPLPSELSLGLPQVDVPEQAMHLPLSCLGAVGKDYPSFGDFSNVREFRERLLSSTAEIQAQQEHLKTMQEHLDMQRNSLLSKQRDQEELLLQKQRQLEEQMKLHQEELEKAIGFSEQEEDLVQSDVCWRSRKEQYHFMSTLLEELEDSSQDDLQQETSNEFSSSPLLKPPGRDPRWRPSKPPVTKTKLGPLLEQHELSAILEVETPTSGRRSSTGLAESNANLPGQCDISRKNEGRPEPIRNPPDASSMDRSCNGSRNKLSWKEMLSAEGSHGPTSTGQPSKIRTDIDHEELGLSAVTTFSMDQSHPRFSWREMLSLDGSRYGSHQDLLSTPIASGSPVIDRGTPLNPSVSRQTAQYGESTHGASPDGIGENLSTTVSTGSFLTSEKADSSPANSDAMSELHKCDYSVIGDVQDGKTVTEPDMRWHALMTPLENGSHIQRIIEKYTKALSASLDRDASFHSPVAPLDTSAAGIHFPTTFYSLDPKPDFSVSSSSSSCTFSSQTSGSLYTKDTSPASQEVNCQEQVIPLSSLQHAPEAPPDTSATDNHFPQMFYTLDPKPDLSVSTQSCAISHQTSRSLYTGDVSQDSQDTNSKEQQRSPWTHPQGGADLRLPVGVPMSPNIESDRSPSRNVVEPADSSGSFLPLHPESTLNDTDVTNKRDASHRLLAQRLESVDTLGAQNVAEESGSFHELLATKSTVNDSELSEQPVPYHEENHFKSDHFQELPVVHKDNRSQEDLGSTGQFPPVHKNQETSVPLRLGSCSSNETEMDASNQTLVPGSVTLGSHSGSFLMSSLMTGSSAGSLPSCVYSWASSSARGIMEEPDLTLLSLNDSSIVCSEPAVTRSSISETQEDGGSIQSSFKPLPAEVDTSGVGQADQSSFGVSLSRHFAGIDLEYTSTPGSLQEAFLKKKKPFIEKSSKRIQEIKTKDRFPTIDLRSEPKDGHVGQVGQHPGSDPVQLKKVVKVRVSTPEDRKLTEIEMHQRTIRLYSQLDEVKIRKEEKMRQETYAKNRDKAKEFKKRTLEKLRANKRK